MNFIFNAICLGIVEKLLTEYSNSVNPLEAHTLLINSCMILLIPVSPASRSPLTASISGKQKNNRITTDFVMSIMITVCKYWNKKSSKLTLELWFLISSVAPRSQTTLNCIIPEAIVIWKEKKKGTAGTGLLLVCFLVKCMNHPF